MVYVVSDGVVGGGCDVVSGVIVDILLPIVVLSLVAGLLVLS